jgi:acid-sensing ion channel, other
MLLASVQNYCNETTLHGFKYFTAENCRLSEKLFWMISLIASLLGAVFLINKLHTEISKTPIVTVTSNTPMLIEEIPFPAVTFCSEMRIQQGQKYYDLMKTFYGAKTNDRIFRPGFFKFLVYDRFKYLAAIDLIMDDDSTLPFNITFDGLELIDILRKYIFERWTSDRRILQNSGSWRDMFEMKIATVITRFGFCATFNIIEPDELLNLDL